MGVEHNLAKVGVASSNLVSRSSFVLLRLRLTGQEMGGMSGRHLKCRDFNSAFSSKVFSLGLYCSGAIAKRLCTGLQIHVGRFDSGSRLHLFGDPHSPKLRQERESKTRSNKKEEGIGKKRNQMNEEKR